MKKLLLTALLLASVGCVNDLLSGQASYDKRPLTLQTVDLFNQRMPSRLAKSNWRGDWIFRRDRLDLIDRELRNIKPDILMMQGVMNRVGSAAEADRAILLAGALAEDDWRQQPVSEYTDTQELESLAVVASVPAHINKDLREARHLAWGLGDDGYAMAEIIDYETQPILVFNVKMPTGLHADVWYAFLKERINDTLRKTHLCPKRLIVGGFLPGDSDTQTRRLSDLSRALQLKDSSAGFCQNASRCFTSTPVNDIFMATIGDETPLRTDKLLVPASAFVYGSARDFEDSDNGNRYVKEFGFTRLWPTQRFGWTAQTRLARCSQAEIDGIQPKSP